MSKLPSYFELQEEHTPELLELLQSVSLGTNGTIYRHLNTAERLKQIDSPLHLCFKRREKLLANVTFCRRDEDWYVRYFAFDAVFQGKGKKSVSQASNSILKRELNIFFDDVLEGQFADYNQGKEVNSFYAYVDPRNTKSLNLVEQFHFERDRTVVTQSFSRRRLKENANLCELTWEDISEHLALNQSKLSYYHPETTRSGPIFGLKKEGRLVAYTKITLAEWEFERLPGKYGKFLFKALPFVPVLRKLLQVKNHKFIVPEAVWVEDNNPQLLEEFFKTLLAHYKRNVIMWWVDAENELYTQTKNQVSWGLLNSLLGVHEVYLMSRKRAGNSSRNMAPAYICGIDFV